MTGWCLGLIVNSNFELFFKVKMALKRIMKNLLVLSRNPERVVIADERDLL